MKYKLNWLPDPKDHRDLFYMDAFRRSILLPDAWDLRTTKFFSEIQDQGQLGSCTGQAINGIMEFNERKASASVTLFEGSALALYLWARQMEGTVKVDSGAYIRDVVKGSAKKGNPSESLYPYNIRNFAKSPSREALADAKKHKTSFYYRLQTLDEICDALFRGFPVAFGFVCVESIFNPSVTKTGYIPLPKKSEQVIGGHAVVAVGYDRTKRLIYFRNSWSSEWGDKGYGSMDFKWFENISLTSDFWVVEK